MMITGTWRRWFRAAMRPRNKVGIAAATSTAVSCYLWYRADVPVLEAISISSLGKMIAAVWSNGSRRRGACMAHILALGTIGGVGRKKPMRVSIGVQDHFGRWHKLVFRGLRGT
jgi:hypothetical protein